MSKLSRQLQERTTGDVYAKKSNAYSNSIFSVRESLTPIGDHLYQEYRLDVCLGARFVSKEPSMHNMQALQARHRIVEEVFGEFRPQLFAIFKALNEADISLALEELSKLETQMFEVN